MKNFSLIYFVYLIFLHVFLTTIVQTHSRKDKDNHTKLVASQDEISVVVEPPPYGTSHTVCTEFFLLKDVMYDAFKLNLHTLGLGLLDLHTKSSWSNPEHFTCQYLFSRWKADAWIQHISFKRFFSSLLFLQCFNWQYGSVDTLMFDFFRN